MRIYPPVSYIVFLGKLKLCSLKVKDYRSFGLQFKRLPRSLQNSVDGTRSHSHAVMLCPTVQRPAQPCSQGRSSFLLSLTPREQKSEPLGKRLLSANQENIYRTSLFF